MGRSRVVKPLPQFYDYPGMTLEWHPRTPTTLEVAYVKTGHILRKVYNCRERKNFRPPNSLKFPVKKIHFLKISDGLLLSHLQRKKFLDIPSLFPFHPPKILTTFFSHFLHFLTAQPTFYIIHSLNFTLYTILFYAFSLFQFKLYNYNCTIPILQLQITFYNCTNCHQLHVKICPASR